MTSEHPANRIYAQLRGGYALWRKQRGAAEAAPLFAGRPRLFVSFALVLLHVGPGVVMRLTLLVSIFALLQVGSFRTGGLPLAAAMGTAGV